MKKTIISLVLFALFSITYGQSNNSNFTIYLVRHAEKVIDKNNLKDPPLTECGEKRAEALADFLMLTDIDKVYSTDYVRTIKTAKPLAEAKKLDIDLYNSKKLQEFSQKILKQGENALIVGHRNTTPTLAGFLTNQSLELIHESIYYLIYQVNVSSDSRTLNLYKSQFNCEN